MARYISSAARSKLMQAAETKFAAERLAKLPDGYRVRETRKGVTYAECVEILTRNGFTVSAGSYEDGRTIQVFSVELQHGAWGEPKYSVSYHKASGYLHAG